MLASFAPTVPDLVKYKGSLCFYLNCRKVGLSLLWTGTDQDPVDLRLFFNTFAYRLGHMLVALG